jgi:hypothetical protein
VSLACAQSNVNTPLAHKRRMEEWSDGSELWPSLFSMSLFGATMPNEGRLLPSPQSARAAFKAGMPLAGGTFLNLKCQFLQLSLHRICASISIYSQFVVKKTPVVSVMVGSICGDF